jgi:hypothetical protein
MAGLLDFLNSAEAQAGLGLLAAGGARSDGANFGQRMIEGLGQGDRWKAQQAAAKRAAMQDEMQQMQMAQAQAQMAQQQKLQGLASQFAKPEGFDYGGYANAMAGVDPMRAMEIQKSLAKQGPEFSTAPQYDQQGRAFILAKDGTMKYLDGVKARDKLEEVRLGDKVAFRSPYSTEMQGSMAIGQSADSKASNAVAWANNAATLRGQNMTDARARDMNDITRGEKKKIEELTKGGQIASFDTMLGTLDRLGSHPGLSRSVGIVGAFPTMPGSESANFKAELDTFQSQAFIPMVSQLKGMGALSDAEGKKLTAAVGALNPNMGEKAFRESVGRITSEMAAARERVSGVPTNLPSKAAEPGNVMSALPTANASNKGRKIRDTTTGKVLVSNGMAWTEAP